MAVNGYSFRAHDLAQVLQQNARSLVSLGFQGLGIGDVGIAESEGMRSAEDTSYVSTRIMAAATDVDGCQENESFRNHKIHRTREGQAAGDQIGLPSPSSWRMGTVAIGLDMGPQAPRKLEIDDLEGSVVQPFLGSPTFPNVRGGGPSVRADGTAARSPPSNSTALQIDSDGRRQGMANKQVCSATMIDETARNTLLYIRGYMFESTEIKRRFDETWKVDGRPER